jgi:hypothetical protein
METFSYLMQKEYPFDESVMEHVAEHGTMEMVKLLHERGCPITYKTMLAATKNTRLEVVNYLVEQKCPMDSRVMHQMKRIRINGKWNEEESDIDSSDSE